MRDEEDGVWVPAPSPEEVQRAAPHFTKRQLALWGVPWPPPAGWRARLAELHAQGAEVMVVADQTTKHEARRKARMEGTPVPPEAQRHPPTIHPPGPRGQTNLVETTYSNRGRVKATRWERDIGKSDPDDPPPWV